MSSLYDRSFAEINLDNIRRNLIALRMNISPDIKVCAIVKADAYGHGCVPVAKVLDDLVYMYGVASIDEAIILRKHNINKPILVLGPTNAKRDFDFLTYRIIPTIFSIEAASSLSECALSSNQTLEIALAVDTGMNRIGLQCDEEGLTTALVISVMKGLHVSNIFTHFARADESIKAPTIEQICKFDNFIENLKNRGLVIDIAHAANSAGIIDHLGEKYDLIRAGVSMYGVYPSSEVNMENVELFPAMTLKSHITNIKKIGIGEAVSYGGTFVANKSMTVATVCIGYADGYPREMSNKGEVLVNANRCKILGRVCMDQLMIDVTGITVNNWDEVTLLGRDGKQEITLSEIAEKCNGFTYELMCNIGKRIPRVYIQNGKVVGTKDYFDDRFYELC